ncbi:MAG: hypothetical protein K9M49_01455 [Candidatus Marinimicrobia bacterium]|nr:hypothetical protein [Candidatus Neomarinimicrobiota bacterium]MCF7903794.1 hypothetical protein [Candidatus Neomarinimicrobiota bacterium]
MLRIKAQSVLILLLFGQLSFLNGDVFRNDTGLSKEELSRIGERAVIIREIEGGERSGVTQEAIGLIKASPEKVLEIITGFSSYPEFMPNLKRIETLEQTDTTAVLNYFLELPMSIEQKYRLKMTWEATDVSDYLVAWQSVDWPGLKPQETIKATHGFWNIMMRGDDETLVVYHAYVDPGPVPFGFGWVVDFLMKTSFPEVFTQTRARIESL